MKDYVLGRKGESLSKYVELYKIYKCIYIYAYDIYGIYMYIIFTYSKIFRIQKSFPWPDMLGTGRTAGYVAARGFC